MKILKFNFILLLFIFSVISCRKDLKEEILVKKEKISFSRGFVHEMDTVKTKVENNFPDRCEDGKLVSVIKLDTDKGSQPLYLLCYVSDKIKETVETRGILRNNNNLYESLGVFAYEYPSSSTWNDTQTPNLLYNVELSKNNLVTDKEWPGRNKKIRFFAYAPYNASGLEIQHDTDPGFSFTYTVSDNVLQQEDLLFAKTDEYLGNANVTVPLNFKHILAAIKFKTGRSVFSGSINKISINWIAKKGKYFPSKNEWQRIITSRSDFATYEINPNKEILHPNEDLSENGLTLFLIPQNVAGNSNIVVDYFDNRTGQMMKGRASFSQSNGISKWESGKTYTYKLSISPAETTPVLDIQTPTVISHEASEQDCRIKSYILVSKPGQPIRKEPRKWKASFSIDNGKTWRENRPDEVLEYFKTSGGGTEPESVFSIKMRKGQIKKGNLHDLELQDTPEVNDYDLSTMGGNSSVNTANCYVVNAPGTYKLPLVYGNGILKGRINESAYKSYGTNNSSYTYVILNTFVNDLNQPITSPYIYNNYGCIPHDCELIWEDAHNLIQNVRLGPTRRYLYFDVNKNSIKQGNAIVAVRRADGTIMWSWHIWVTTYKIYEHDLSITNHNNKEFSIMSVDLGTCFEDADYYPSAKVMIKVIQLNEDGTPNDNVQKIITIQRKGTEKDIKFTPANCTYYQYGRKDPFPGVLFVDKTTSRPKPVYTRTVTPGNKIGATTIGDAIRMPEKFVMPTYEEVNDKGMRRRDWCIGYNQADWNKQQQVLNLWNATIEAPENMRKSVYNPYNIDDKNIVVKTIYDPCPAGYSVAPIRLWTGITTTGQSTTNRSEWNLNWPDDLGLGYFFHGLPNKQGDKIWLPMFGFKKGNDSSGNPSDGAIEGYGTVLYRASATPIDPRGSTAGMVSTFEVLDPLTGGNRIMGLPIRPIRNE